MNNLTLVALAILFLCASCDGFDAGSQEYSLPDSPKLENASSGSSNTVEAGLKFKHGGCNQPVGICFTTPIREPKPKKPKPLFNSEQTADGWGGAIISLLDDQLRITPYRRAHDENGWVPITDDILVDEEIAEALGQTSITILADEYPIDLEVENEWGEFYVNILTE